MSRRTTTSFRCRTEEVFGIEVIAKSPIPMRMSRDVARRTFFIVVLLNKRIGLYKFLYE